MAEATPIERQEGESVELSSTEARPKLKEVIESTPDAKAHELSPEEQTELLFTLEARFSKEPEHYKRPGISFAEVKAALEANSEAMWSLALMELRGGEPDIIAIEDDAFIFADCSAEPPRWDRYNDKRIEIAGKLGETIAGSYHRDLTYEQVLELAKKFGVDLMDETTYRKLQEIGKFDIETLDSAPSTYLKTPADPSRSLKGYVLVGSRSDDHLDIRPVDGHFSHWERGWRGILRVPI